MNDEPSIEELLLAAEVRKLAVGRAVRAARLATGSEDAEPSKAQWIEATLATVRELDLIARDIRRIRHPDQT